MSFKARFAIDVTDKFLNSDFFADEALLFPAGTSSTVTIKGILRDPYEAASPMQIDTDNTSLTFLAKTGDVSDATIGSTIEINQVTYNVIARRPHRTLKNVTELRLSEDA